MRIYSGAAVLAVVLVAFGSESTGSGPAFAEAAKRPSRGSSSGGSRRSSRGGASGGGRSRGPPPRGPRIGARGVLAAPCSVGSGVL